MASFSGVGYPSTTTGAIQRFVDDPGDVNLDPEIHSALSALIPKSVSDQTEVPGESAFKATGSNLFLFSQILERDETP